MWQSFLWIVCWRWYILRFSGEPIISLQSLASLSSPAITLAKFTGTFQWAYKLDIFLVSKISLFIKVTVYVWFRYTSLLAVSVGVLLFILTSFTDPGTVTAENVSLYLAAYPYDNVIYSEKMCSTCKIPKSVSLSFSLPVSLSLCLSFFKNCVWLK